MSVIPNLEILSNVNAKYTSASFKTITFGSATTNYIVLKDNIESTEIGVTLNKTAWNKILADIAKTVSKENSDLQTIQGQIKVNGGICADVFKSASGSSITAFTYLANKGFEYSNIYQMKPYGKTDPFFVVNSGTTTLSATEVKGTRLYENGTDISTVYLKKGAVPADVYSKEDIDKKLSEINTTVAKKQDKLTAGANIALSGTTISVTGVYTSSKVDSLLTSKVDKTTYEGGIASKQDLLQVGGNLIAGANVTITKDTTGRITISSTGGGGGTVDAYTKSETDSLLAKKQDKLTAGANISITTSSDSTTITTKNIYSSNEIDSKVTTLNNTIATKQDKLTAGANISISTSGSTTTINTKNIYTNTEVDSKVSTLNTSIATKQDKLTAGSNISISTSGSTTTINTKDIYTSAQVDTALATKQDILVPGTNLIAGDNININKDTDNKITITATSADLTDLINRVTELETALGGYKLKAVTQAEYDALTTKDPNTLYFIKAS